MTATVYVYRAIVGFKACGGGEFRVETLACGHTFTARLKLDGSPQQPAKSRRCAKCAEELRHVIAARAGP